MEKYANLLALENFLKLLIEFVAVLSLRFQFPLIKKNNENVFDDVKNRTLAMGEKTHVSAVLCLGGVATKVNFVYTRHALSINSTIESNSLEVF